MSGKAKFITAVILNLLVFVMFAIGFVFHIKDQFYIDAATDLIVVGLTGSVLIDLCGGK